MVTLLVVDGAVLLVALVDPGPAPSRTPRWPGTLPGVGILGKPKITWRVRVAPDGRPDSCWPATRPPPCGPMTGGCGSSWPRARRSGPRPPSGRPPGGPSGPAGGRPGHRSLSLVSRQATRDLRGPAGASPVPLQGGGRAAHRQGPTARGRSAVRKRAGAEAPVRQQVGVDEGEFRRASTGRPLPGSTVRSCGPSRPSGTRR